MDARNAVIQTVGFWLQTIPLAWLLWNFGDAGDFRISRKRSLLIVAAVLTVAGIGLPIWILGLSGYIPGNMAGNIFILPIIVFLFVFWKMTYKKESLEVIISFSLILHYAVIVFTLNNLLNAVFWKGNIITPPVPYGISTNVNYIIIYAVTFLPVYILTRYVNQGLKGIPRQRMKRVMIYVAVIILCYMGAVEPVLRHMDKHTFTVLLFWNINIFFTYLLFFNELHHGQEQAEMEKQMQIYHLQYQKIDAQIRSVRRMHHDIRQHLRVINQLNEDGKQDEIRDYLKKYDEVYSGIENHRFTGDSSIDSILGYYREIASSSSIDMQFHCAVNKECLPEIDTIDMVVLLGNCMENAIESCLLLSGSTQRFIHVHIWAKEKPMLLLEIENSCISNPEEESRDFQDYKNFVSSKKGRAEGGQGLLSIHRVALKYQGSAMFRRNENVFCTRVVLNNKLLKGGNIYEERGYEEHTKGN